MQNLGKFSLQNVEILCEKVVDLQIFTQLQMQIIPTVLVSSENLLFINFKRYSFYLSILLAISSHMRFHQCGISYVGSSYQLVRKTLDTTYKIVVSRLYVHFLNVLSSDNLLRKSLDSGYKNVFYLCLFICIFKLPFYVKPFEQ